MLSIALRSGEGATSITDINQSEGISVSYLEQLLNKLRRNGLITSIRGPKGGYILTRVPKKITVADIVTALEGDIYPVHCIGGHKDWEKFCKKGKGCVPKIVWVKLAKAIKECLESVTLDDLCCEARKIDN